jgi:AcrR family transcriptional regulator
MDSVNIFLHDRGMSNSPAQSDRRPYHHGDLRAALLAAAETLLHESGTWGFSLREVARRAAVSHSAPYSHFPDKRALMASVAEIGFVRLRGVLEKAGTGDSSPLPYDRIVDLAVAYVRFASANRAMFRLMFSEELSQVADLHNLTRSTEAAFDILPEAVIAAGHSESSAQSPDSAHSLAAWALVHGLSTLIIDGRVPIPEDPELFDALVSQTAKMLVFGLKAAVPECD